MKPINGVTVIGVGHKARHGKDSVANIILNSVSGSKRYSFADDLKAFARVLGMRTKNGPVLQALGTDVFRALNDDIWVECLYARLLEEKPTVAVIPDVRFPNEVKLVEDLGGSLIKIERFNEDGSIYVTNDRDPNHPSEIALDDFTGWNYILQAKSGDLVMLENSTKKILRYIGV